MPLAGSITSFSGKLQAFHQLDPKGRINGALQHQILVDAVAQGVDLSRFQACGDSHNPTCSVRGHRVQRTRVKGDVLGFGATDVSAAGKRRSPGCSVPESLQVHGEVAVEGLPGLPLCGMARM